MDRQKQQDAPTDRSLVLLARQGDSRAFRLLAQRYTPLVASVLHRKLRDHRDVDDEIQETFLRAHDSLGTLDDPARFSGWIARIAINRAHTRARQLGRQKETPHGTREMVEQVGVCEVWAWQWFSLTFRELDRPGPAEASHPPSWRGFTRMRRDHHYRFHGKSGRPLAIRSLVAPRVRSAPVCRGAAARGLRGRASSVGGRRMLSRRGGGAARCLGEGCVQADSSGMRADSI